MAGPFAATSDLVAGFWRWQAASMEEADAWEKRCPNPFPVESEIEPRDVARAQRAGTAARAVGGVRQARSGQASRPPRSRDVAFETSACATMASVP